MLLHSGNVIYTIDEVSALSSLTRTVFSMLDTAMLQTYYGLLLQTGDAYVEVFESARRINLTANLSQLRSRSLWQNQRCSSEELCLSWFVKYCRDCNITYINYMYATVFNISLNDHFYQLILIYTFELMSGFIVTCVSRNLILEVFE